MTSPRVKKNPEPKDAAFKISISLLDAVRLYCNNEDRKYKQTIERWIREGLERASA